MGGGLAIMEGNYFKEVKEILRRKGYKLTRPRLVIFSYLLRVNGHPDMQNIYEGIQAEYPGIGMATVYRTIDLFLELGIVRGLTLKDNHLRYEINQPGGHHHHLVCTKCDQIVEFGSCNFQLIAEEIEKVTRFKIREHTLEVYGLCPRCLTVQGAEG